MSVFADSSAIVKLYVEEPGSEAVGSHEPFFVSHLSRVEVESALRRKQRAAELSVASARILVEMFQSDWRQVGRLQPRFLPVMLTPDLLEGACRLLAVHDLRTGDAIQLASALAARRADPECNVFACFDARLSAAASAEGFRTQFS